MPSRHRLKLSNNRDQSECSLPTFQGGRRAPPVVPGRIPLREEAELFLGVTKASAEPETGAIPFGHNRPSTVGLSLYKRIGIETCRFGHASIGPNNNIPLRNHDVLESNSSAKTVLIRGQPRKYNDDFEFNGSTNTVLIRGQSVGPYGNLGIDSTSAICGSSEGDAGARQEAKEPTIFTDSSKTDYFIDSTLIDNIVSHQKSTLDKLHTHKIIYAPQMLIPQFQLTILFINLN